MADGFFLRFAQDGRLKPAHPIVIRTGEGQRDCPLVLPLSSLIVDLPPGPVELLRPDFPVGISGNGGVAPAAPASPAVEVIRGDDGSGSVTVVRSDNGGRRPGSVLRAGSGIIQVSGTEVPQQPVTQSVGIALVSRIRPGSGTAAGIRDRHPGFLPVAGGGGMTVVTFSAEGLADTAGRADERIVSPDGHGFHLCGIIG